MLSDLSSYRRLIALLLPAVLIWSWTACVSGCGETTSGGESAIVFALDAGDESVNANPSVEVCKITAAPAAFQDRKAEPAPLPADVEIAVPPVRRSVFTPALQTSDVKQNSPPANIPIFIRLHAFRI